MMRVLLVVAAATINLRSASSSFLATAAAGFLLPSSCRTTKIKRRRHQRHQHDRKKNAILALSSNNNNNNSKNNIFSNRSIPSNFEERMIRLRHHRCSSSSSFRVCHLHNMRYGLGEYDYDDDDQRLRVKKQRVQDPIIQDFGSISDWNAMKTGTVTSGNNRNSSSMRRRRRLGDDEVNERRRRFLLDDENEEGEGGNFWINPINSMDRYNNYPLPPPPPPPPNAIVGDTALTMMNNRRSRDVAFNRRRSNGGGRDILMGGGGVTSSSNRMRRKVSPGARPSGDGLWYETKRGAMTRDRYDEDYENDYDSFLDDDEFDDDVNDERRQREDYYGPPPPTRSRSSFRSGAPSPPRPLKEFYDKLFWFGFDPNTTGPDDRTMFGGTRGRFNALDLLRDREERQRQRQRQYLGDNYYDDDDIDEYDDDYNDGGGRRRNNNNYRRRRGNDSIIQDFGTVRDWDTRKNGRGRVGGDAIGDDIIYSRGGTFPFTTPLPPRRPRRPPPPLGDFDDVDFFSLADDDEDDIAGRAMQRRRQRRRQRGGGVMRGRIDPRAEEYDNRFLGLGPPPLPNVVSDDPLMDDNYRQFDRPLSSSSRQQQRRRRRGFAYKYNDIDLLNNDDDGEYIDIEPLYATNRDLDMAKSRSRSWEERAIERDRVPPRDGIAWGPNGQVIGESPLNVAAMDALRDIKKIKRLLVRKEEDVELAKAKVVNLQT